jgi:hypothetical protein
VAATEGAGLDGDLAEVGAPVQRRRVGHLDLADDRVADQVDQLVLVGDVPVERHRADAQSLGDAAHRDRLGAFVVGDLDRGAHDLVAAERAHTISSRRAARRAGLARPNGIELGRGGRLPDVLLHRSSSPGS